MARKIIPIISVVAITALGILFLFDSSSYDNEQFAQTFDVDAIYYENQRIVEISFNDNSQKTSSVVLEILGMEETFQKTFEGSSFVETVQFDSTPKYGWQIHPITLVVDHQELGRIGIKTEIHSENEPAPPIIFSP
ncbi:hypothetical protein LCGC14_3100340 [marine sediment metagenome]|uniref:Uncharacterized protein n=1 Tax=marine sediment metagenome TaxID=412755 RepID=A0A0F8YY29_9ZZZZ